MTMLALIDINTGREDNRYMLHPRRELDKFSRLFTPMFNNMKLGNDTSLETALIRAKAHQTKMLLAEYL